MSYSFFDKNHWNSVLAARSKEGLPSNPEINKPVDHPLIGRKFVNKDNCKQYTLVSATKDWDQGWVTVGVIATSDGSGCGTVVLNTSPSAPDYMKSKVNRFFNNFQLCE